MKVSLKWLHQLVDLHGIDVPTLTNRLSVAGLEVESVYPLSQGNHLVIGEVISSVSVPESDHLHLCTVNTGSDIRQIICGAPNVDKGQKVIVALPGSVLPAKGVTIQKRQVGAYESNGMICSLLELGVPENLLSAEQKEGIEVLSSDAPLGLETPLDYLGLDDTIIEIKPTPNRGDALSMITLARDVAAIMDRPLKPFSIDSIPGVSASYTVETSVPACSIFRIRAVHGVKNHTSPSWLQQRLIASGYRPINAIVDIGNYVMLLVGQPLHMYDARKLTSHQFKVVSDRSGEILALDSHNYAYQPGDLLVINGESVVGLAGIMGSESTMIDDSTTDIVIEAASFDSIHIRKTTRRTQLFSEASSRYVRGFDAPRGDLAIELATGLVRDICGCTSIENVVSSGSSTSNLNVIATTTDQLNRLLGTLFTNDDIRKVWNRLGFSFIEENSVFKVTIPSYRPDLSIPEDLAEEVIRILGFDHMVAPLSSQNSRGHLTPTQHKKRLIREYLVSNGLFESLTYTLEDQASIDLFNWLTLTPATSILMPMTEERSFLRRSLIPSLLRATSYNQARQVKDVSLFELSSVYFGGQEKNLLAFVLSNHHQPTLWQKPGQSDFYLAKGLVEGILQLLGIENTRIQWERIETSHPHLHPGRSAYLVSGKQRLGVVGEVHPQLITKFDCDRSVVVEINLSELLEMKTNRAKFTSPALYPSITRDLAVIVSDTIEANSLVKTIKRKGKGMVSDVQLFDVYKGDHVPPKHQSIAITITYQDPSKTLTDALVSHLHQEVIRALETEFKAVLRT